MIEHASSPLLLFPEYIIFFLIALCIASFILCLLLFFKFNTLSRDILDRAVFEKTRDNLKRVAESYDDIRRKHEKLGRDYAELWQENEKLKMKYDGAWRELQDVCDLIGPLVSYPDENPPPLQNK